LKKGKKGSVGSSVLKNGELQKEGRGESEAKKERVERGGEEKRVRKGYTTKTAIRMTLSYSQEKN